MNRSLVYFALFLILISIGFGIYLLTFLGVLLLIPALMSPARPPAPRTPPATAQPPRRIIPPTPVRPAVTATESQPMASTSMYAPTATPTYAPTQYQGYSGPLFSTPMFPSLSQMGAPAPTTSQPPPTNQGRDELLEVGAILAVLKLLSG